MKENKSKFFITATPIGNLNDVSKRLIETLKEVDFILAEDTRVIKKILNSFEIETLVRRYNEHDHEKNIKEIENSFSKGKGVALVTDAGTPGISDPGFKLVDYVRKNFPKTDIRVIPGPSAVTSALSVSGIPSSQFTFLGFPPSKNKRNKFFENIKNIEVRPVVLFESPHRLQKTFDDIENIMGDIDVFVAKEMTKIFEDYFRGSISDAKEYFIGDKSKGEFVIIIP